MPNRISTLLDRLTPQQVKRARVLRSYQTVFGTDAGRMVLNDLINVHGVMRTSMFTGDDAGDGAERAIRMAFAEGERNVVLRIVVQLGLDWDHFHTLIQEESDNET